MHTAGNPLGNTQEILAMAQAATWRWDIVNDRIYTTPLVQSFFNLTEEEANGGPALAYERAMHVDDRERAMLALEEAIRTGDGYEVEYRVQGADGKERWVLARGKGERSENGETVALVGILVDITDRKIPEAALRASEARLRTVLDRSPAFTALLRGPNHVYEYVNEDYIRLVGQRDLIGLSVKEALPEVDNQGYIEILNRVYETGEPFRGSELLVRLDRKKGELIEDRYVNVVYQPLREPDGSITGVFSQGVDITEQVRSRRALASERQRFRSLLDEVPGHVVTISGPELIYEFANRQFLAFMGIPDVVGRSVEEVWPEIPPSHLEMLRHLMNTGETFMGTEAPVTTPSTSPNPGRIGFYDFVFQPTREEDGTVSGIFVYSLDVSEKVLARQEIAAREEQFRTVFENAEDDAVILMDSERTIQAWNPAAERICGWTRDEAIGQSADIIFTPEDRADEVPQQEATKAIRDGKAADERWHIRKDGKRFWGSGTMSALRHSDGDGKGFMKVFRDASERHEMERRTKELNEDLEERVERRTAELVAKNAELEGFTYSVSHDMRTPLRGIIANARIVLEEEGDKVSQQGQARLERLSSAALKMAELVDDLLQYARLGTREMRMEAVDLIALAEQIAKEVNVECPGSKFIFAAESPLMVQADPRVLGMALRNLFDNSCKYAQKGTDPEVQFGYEMQADERVFYVRDNGIGFDMAYVNKLFQPFERLHRDEYAGTGIGLANVKRAIARHRGRVWAEGDLNKGATFYFTLGD